MKKGSGKKINARKISFLKEACVLREPKVHDYSKAPLVIAFGSERHNRSGRFKNLEKKFPFNI